LFRGFVTPPSVKETVMKIQLVLPRNVLLVLALAGGLGCASGAEVSPPGETALALAPRGCGASTAPAAPRPAPRKAPPVVAMCR
jgi:hypothetical protein